ncbi:MAG: hypothetical protein VX871_04340 [Pseudomonadota bacterium]|nr:hypothetical protein [Pseudomonadota bacterium]
METILAFIVMNALLAIVMAALAFQLQRNSAGQARIVTVAMLPFMCWALWSAGYQANTPKAHYAGMASLMPVHYTGAISIR